MMKLQNFWALPSLTAFEVPTRSSIVNSKIYNSKEEESSLQTCFYFYFISSSFPYVSSPIIILIFVRCPTFTDIVTRQVFRVRAAAGSLPRSRCGPSTNQTFRWVASSLGSLVPWLRITLTPWWTPRHKPRCFQAKSATLPANSSLPKKWQIFAKQYNMNIR